MPAEYDAVVGAAMPEQCSLLQAAHISAHDACRSKMIVKLQICNCRYAWLTIFVASKLPFVVSVT